MSIWQIRSERAPRHRRRSIQIACYAALALLATDSAALSQHTYILDVVADFDAGTFAGKATVTVRNQTTDDLDALCFRLYPNAETIYGAAALCITEVSVSGEPEAFVLDQNDTVLVVPLPGSLAIGETIEVGFLYEGSTAVHDTDDWPAGEYGLMTRTASTMTLSAFYPLLAPYTREGWAIDPVLAYGDAVMADASDYVVSLTVSSGLSVYTTGHQVTAKAASGVSTYTYEAADARDFAVVLAEETTVSERTVSGITLRAAFLPRHAEALGIALDIAEGALRLFSDRIGPLPYGEVDIVEAPMVRAAGMEFTGLILVATAYAAIPSDAFFSVIVAHELAHQWFYAAVGSDVSESPWLDEGLATYLSYVYLEATGARGVAEQYLDNWKHSFERGRALYPDCTITTPAYAFPDAEAYRVFVYDGAALFWHAVRAALDDEPFYGLLQAYYELYRTRIASTEDMIGFLLATGNAAVRAALTDFEVLRP